LREVTKVPPVPSAELPAELVEQARERSRAMSRADREEQIRNFAAGNVGLEDPRVTRGTVDRVASRVRSG
jgi:hypothetical protein